MDKEKVEQALKNFFRRGNLIALRELALRQVAEQVDRSLESYMVEKDIQRKLGGPRTDRGVHQRQIRKRNTWWRGRRAWRGGWTRSFTPCTWTWITALRAIRTRKLLTANLQFAESLGAKPVRLKGDNVADATAQFVREKHITQVIFGRTAVEGWRKLLYLNAINRFLRDAPAVDVHIVTQEPD